MTNLLIMASFAIGGVQPNWQGMYSTPITSVYSGTGAMAPVIPAGGIQANGVLLANLDRDGDGRLGPQELPERLLRVFHKADRNNDGFLDDAEIALGRTRISQQARKLENLRLDRRGELAERGGGGLGGGAGVAGGQRMAGGGARRLGRLERQMPEAVPAAATAMVNPYLSVPPSAPETPATSAGVPVPPASAPPSPMSAGFPASPVPQGVAKGRAGEEGAAGAARGGLPTAEQILANLDRNGDGLVDTGEAVDQLADNFARLDKDKSGGLDRDEIDRGLRLARLFGIKPKVDPRSYQRSANGSPRAN